MNERFIEEAFTLVTDAGKIDAIQKRLIDLGIDVKAK